MSTPSPQKPSSLSERLQADQEQIQRQLADQTQALLTQHASGLKQLLNADLRSTKSALERHRSVVGHLHQETIARIRWMLLWPVMTTVLLSLLMLVVVVTWTTYRLDQVSEAQNALDQASAGLTAKQQAAQQVPPQPPRKRK
jgi:hypothetical protein